MDDAWRKPTFRFMLRHPAHVIALGFGSGLAPVAPGTFGTLLALVLFHALALYVDDFGMLGLIAAGFVLGSWACGRTGRALGRPDHGGMVWDEVIAFMLVLVFVPRVVSWQAAAFVVFRLFDILKPPPIRFYDRLLKSGFGVMFDDLIAAFYTLIVIAIGKILIDG